MTTAGSQRLSEKDERTYTSLGNILGILGFLPSLIVFLMFRERSSFLNRNMKSALNFQITMIIADIVGTILSIVGIGGLIILAAWILRLVFSILAFVKTNEGEDYVYPVTISFIK
jgi:uncharacterized Tic20 family protein